jgi:hypothetical protein
VFRSNFVEVKPLTIFLRLMVSNHCSSYIETTHWVFFNETFSSNWYFAIALFVVWVYCWLQKVVNLLFLLFLNHTGACLLLLLLAFVVFNDIMAR